MAAFDVALSNGGGGGGGDALAVEAFFAGGPSTGVGGVRALAMLASVSKRGLAERPLPLAGCFGRAPVGGVIAEVLGMVARGPVLN